MRAATDKNGNDYWEYVLLYVDDCLVISHRGEDVLRKEIGVHFTLKESSIGPPDIYLGGKVNNVTVKSTEGPKEAWSFSSSQYVKTAVSNVEKYLREKGMKLPKERDSTLSSNYRP